MRKNVSVTRLILTFLLSLFLLTDNKGNDKANNDSITIKKTNSFFDTLQNKASKNRLTKELYDIMVVNGNVNKKQPPIYVHKSNNYEKYNGKLIRKIEIIDIDIFGPEVYDTTLITKKFIEKTANKLHINTSKRIIQNHLILKSGHYFNNNELADNERILRKLPSVNDARIVVSNVDELNNTVDLTVIIKDVWSKGFGLETSDFKNGRVDFWDRNIFGTGHDLTNMIVWDNDKTDKIGYQGQYKIKNIFASFIDAQVNYISIFDHNEFNVKLLREFFTPETHYAGGISYTDKRQNKFIRTIDIADTFHLDYEYTNIWIARAFPITNKKYKNFRSNLIFSLAYNKYDYYDGPPVEEYLFYDYQSRAMFLGAISFTSQDFYKTNYLYSFGRTEDIPLGILASVKMGFERNDFKDRLYTQFTCNLGYHYTNVGYLFNGFDISFFTNYIGNIEQGAVQYRFNYFTDLIKIKRFRFRQFANLNYLNGFGRYQDEMISINNKYGIRGFSTDSIFYQKKLIFNFESVFFTPLYFYGFRFVLFGFADICFTSPDNKIIFTSKPYSGFGIGFRIRNDKLTFRTIQIQFGYYPGAPPDVDKTRILMSGEPRLRPESFYVKEPKIFEFK